MKRLDTQADDQSPNPAITVLERPEAGHNPNRCQPMKQYSNHELEEEGLVIDKPPPQNTVEDTTAADKARTDPRPPHKDTHELGKILKKHFRNVWCLYKAESAQRERCHPDDTDIHHCSKHVAPPGPTVSPACLNLE